MVQINISMDAQDFWTKILGSHWEEYPWWVGVKYLDGAAWNKVGKVKVEAHHDIEGSRGAKVIGIDDLVEAYDTLISKGVKIDLGNLDARTGDLILRQAVTGTI